MLTITTFVLQQRSQPAQFDNKTKNIIKYLDKHAQHIVFTECTHIRIYRQVRKIRDLSNWIQNQLELNYIYINQPKTENFYTEKI